MPPRPGITFETETPSVPDALPRMDIAAFVGFATRGPIDVPVPVEDLNRFRDVFGPPLKLVRDQEAGRTKRAHLHRAVEAFFRNGGRRCWVVRVAQSRGEASSGGTVERTSFGLPGLVSAETGKPSTVRARCYGATFDEMRVGTVLRRRLLPKPTSVERTGDSAPEGGLTLSWDATHRDPLEEDVLEEGDLTRLNFCQRRVSVAFEGTSMGSEGPLLKLDVELRTDLQEEEPLRIEAVRGFTTGGEETSITVVERDASDENGAPTVPPGQAGDSKRIEIGLKESPEDLDAFEFTIPASTLSVVAVTDVITEGTRTPDTAKRETYLAEGRFAFASVASRKRVSDGKSGTNGSSLEVQTYRLRIFDRALAVHENPGESPPTVEKIEIEASGEWETWSLSDSPRVVTVGRSNRDEESSGLKLTVITKKKEEENASGEDENAGDDVNASYLEQKLVHLTVKGVRKGWLQLGEATHRYEGNHEGEDAEKVEIEVRDALWPVPREEVVPRESAPPPPVCSAERQRFDLLVWKDRELRTRLDRLGFAEAHSRAWTDLPVDEDLFALQDGQGVTPNPDTLRADVFDPRFPLAGPEAPGEGPFVPLGMADRPDPNRTSGRIPTTPERSRLEKERLSTFSTDVFVDGTFDDGGTVDDLANTSTANLGTKADNKIYVDQKPVSGLHSLWPIREATLLAVPDAVHRGWHEPRTVTPASFAAPSSLNMTVHPNADPPRLHLSWRGDRLKEESVEVEVQEALEPTFEHPTVRYRGSESSVDRYVRSDEPVTLFFRYRFVADVQPEPWSNTRQATLLEPDFDSCTIRPGVPNVARVGTRWFAWGLLPEPAEGSLTYELQIDRSPLFEAPVDVSPEVLPPAKVLPYEDPFSGEETVRVRNPIDVAPQSWHKIPISPDTPAVRYVRLRARIDTGDHTLVGGWSRTVPFVRDLTQRKSCIPTQEYDDPETDTPGGGRDGLLDVQRAMLRFGAARGDVLSVCSLPRHDEPEDARRHATRLRTPGAVLDYGEEHTLSYGALYYPWLLGPADNGARIASMPPDGATCGMIANRTLRDGAWMASANISLADVPTVVSPLTSDERGRLETSSINVFTETPDGVLTLGTATLARDPDLEPITSRRLLILVRRLVQREGPALVFENHTPLLRRRIAEQFDDVLRRLFDRGAFAGATPSEGYRIVADESVNPPRQVERGRLVVELRIAPARPLKFLTVRLLQRSGERPAVSEPGAGAAA